MLPIGYLHFLTAGPPVYDYCYSPRWPEWQRVGSCPVYELNGKRGSPDLFARPATRLSVRPTVSQLPNCAGAVLVMAQQAQARRSASSACELTGGRVNTQRLARCKVTNAQTSIGAASCAARSITSTFTTRRRSDVRGTLAQPIRPGKTKVLSSEDRAATASRIARIKS